MPDQNPTQLIDARIEDLGDWRGQTLAKARQIILAADTDVVEAVKWVKPTNPWGVAVWEANGGICTGEIYKDKVKLTFHKGASLDDPTSLFNSSLEGAVRRAVDFKEGEEIDADALTNLVRQAIALNGAKKR